MFYWITNSAAGGISDGSRRGLKDGYRYSESLDYRTDPDALAVLPATVLDDVEGTITDLVRWIVTDGTNTFAYGNTGNIYQRVGEGGWALLKHVTNSHGQGLAIYSDYLYYTQDSQLGRYGPLSGTPAFTDNFQTAGFVTDTEYHPLETFLYYLVVGNGKYLEYWDGAIWTGSTNPPWSSQIHALTLADGYRVTCLDVWGQYLVAGTQHGAEFTTNPDGRFYLWTGTSVTFDDMVPSTGAINAVLNNNGELFAMIGGQSDMYSYIGGRLVKIKKLPKISNKSIKVEAGAFTSWNNLAMFGTSTGGSSTVSPSTDSPKAVYSFGHTTNNYPETLSLDYFISTGSKSGTNVSIGAILPISPTELLISWQDGSKFGIDRVDGSLYADSATFQSLIFDNTKPFLLQQPHLIRIVIEDNLRAGEFIRAYLRKEGETDWTLVGQTNPTEDFGKGSFTFNVATNLGTNDFYKSKGGQHELRLDFGGENSTRPKLYSSTVTMEEDDDIVTIDTGNE